MKNVKVSIEINNEDVLVGFIKGNTSDDGIFVYDDFYETSDFLPLSVSMPKNKALTCIDTKRYFNGLLPEGYLRQSISSFLKYDETDYLS